MSLIDFIKNSLSLKKVSKPVESVEKEPVKNSKFIDPPKEWKSALKDAYTRYPDLPKGSVETVLMMESSMGTNDSNRKVDYGNYGWLGGHINSKDGAFVDSLNKFRKDPSLAYKIFEKDKNNKFNITNIESLGDPYSAIQATASVLQSKIWNNPEADSLSDIYFKHYVSAPESDTIIRRKIFDDAIDYYK